MKFIFALLFLLPLTAAAHCPFAMEVGGTKYCYDIQWINGEQKLQGQFNDTESLSPQLVVTGTVPQKWVYSRAFINFWIEGDEDHKPVRVDNLKIFPYMEMANGHHHSTSYEFTYNNHDLRYVLQRMALQEMPGCWSLRWTTTGNEDLESSTLIQNLVEYPNLDDAKNAEMADYCAQDGTTGTDGGHGGHHQFH